jgi:exopolysaccharide biosynthesis operon protein EpsL
LKFSRRTAIVAAICMCAPILWDRAFAAPDYRDTLDRAVAAPDETLAAQGNVFSPFVADSLVYDSNLFRLPPDVDVKGVVGPDAGRSDYTNSASAGLSATWLVGNRQSIDLDLRVDDNRFKTNDDLNNVSTADRLVWNWGLGGVLSGQVGADYSRYLASFVNTDVYTRNLINQTEYFAAARMQLGPRWALFGGLLDATNSLTAPESSSNDSRRKSVDIGADFATGAQDSIGFDYRYTDSTYPNPIDINGETIRGDFREDRAQLLVKYLLSDKTTIDATAGYLKREYTSTSIGDFAGDIWRVALAWLPTQKTELDANVWRQLQADLTADTDYFVSTGARIAPIWNATEKISLSLVVSRDSRKYVGTNPGQALGEQRRDTVTGESASLIYTATRALSFNASFGHENRSSNFPQFPYVDNKASAGVNFKF